MYHQNGLKIHFVCAGWLSVTTDDGKRVTAEKEIICITGTPEQIEFLISDGKNGIYRDWAPSLMLNDMDFLHPEFRNCLVNYGVDESLLLFLRQRRVQGSWLDIIEINHLWIMEKDICQNSFGEMLRQYLS